MPKTRAQKAEEIKELTDKLSSNKAAVVAEFSGLTMEDLDSARGKAREGEMSFQVVKNTLLTKAAEEAGIKSLDLRKVARQLAIAVGEDEVAVSKLVYDFSKDSGDKVKVFSGVVDGELIPVETVIQLAQLPSRDELLAQVVGSFNAPISGFVRVLGGPLQGFYNVIKALQENKA